MDLEYMLKTFKELQPLGGALAYAVGTMIYFYSTFATKRELEQVRSECFAHADANYDKNAIKLDRIEGFVLRLEDRSWHERSPAISIDPARPNRSRSK